MLGPMPDTLASLAQDYLQALRLGERHRASRLVMDAVAAGTSVKDVYLGVFQPVQYEVGRLWQTNEISIAQEHYCTAATQLVMSQLYPHIFALDRRGRAMVATCVAGDLHELGVRMVADFFEMDGWDTFYLGANTPHQGVSDTIVERRAEVLAVSATLATHVPAVRELIAVVRASPAAGGVTILVGGHPFNEDPDLWKTVDADATAPDAQQAVDLANRLPGRPVQ